MEVRIPPLDVPASSMLFEKLQHCLQAVFSWESWQLVTAVTLQFCQAVAPVGEFLPKAPVLVPVLQAPCDCSEAQRRTVSPFHFDQAAEAFSSFLGLRNHTLHCGFVVGCFDERLPGPVFHTCSLCEAKQR